MSVITPEQLARNGSEDGHQAALFCYFQINIDKYPLTKWLFAIPNGGYRDDKTAGKLKATGVKRGVPDICLPINGQKFNTALYIELKIPSKQRGDDLFAGCTDEQKEFILFLRSQGHKVEVCYGWEQARDVIVEYLEEK